MGALEGSWGALGAILAHLGPKSQHNTKNHHSLDTTPSILEPSWGPSWAYVEQVSLKRSFKTPLENMLLPNIIFSMKFGVPEPLLDTKIKQNHWRGVKKLGFRLSIKSCSREGSWGPFWTGFWAQVGAKLGQVGAKLGPSAALQPS